MLFALFFLYNNLDLRFIDSELLAHFDEIDQAYLEKIVGLIQND
jgi:putative methionine-R-sulfoxide reductase with GAF domain